ncbi:MATE family efflux transporter [Corallococcus sp. H22C18031201]|nr:MATE family efflux transporter [Corallococcus sp. H22C18031201]
MEDTSPVNGTDAPASSPRQAPEGFGALVREALRGTHLDLTQLPLKRAIILLAVPMVLEMVMESVFAVVDVFFVGRLGADAVATVGLTESLLTLVYAGAMGLSIGATAMVARRVGEKNWDRAARTAVQAMGLGVVLAVVLAGVGVTFARPMMQALGASPWVLEHGVPYTQVMLGGVVSILLLFLFNAIFRGAGDAAIAMRVLWLANGVNILLAPCLIFGLGPFPAMGVVGAAWATTIGRGVGVLYQLWRLVRGDGRLKLRREHLRLEWGTVTSMLRLSGAAAFQNLVNMSSWVVLIRLVSGFGSTALAGYTIAIRLVMFAMLPAYGLANAASTLVGQSLGARQPERGERAVWMAGRYNTVFLGSLGLLFFVFATPILHFFSQDAEVVRQGVMAIRIFSLFFLCWGFGMVLTTAFDGAGDTLTPTLINVFGFWLLELPLAWVLSRPVGLGPEGVFIAVSVSFAFMAAASVILFRRGRWKLRVV